MKFLRSTFTILFALAVLFAVVAPVHAGSAWQDYDTASPLIVRYKGTETATIQVAAGSILQVTDTTTTTTLLANVTLATLSSALNAAQDDEGDKEWECEYWAGIAADTVSTNDLIVVAANAVNREWDYSIKWDVSNELHYDVVCSSKAGSQTVGGYTITDLFGEPAGTGNMTVSVYVGGARKFYKVVTSPIYVAAASVVSPTFTVPSYTVASITNSLVMPYGDTNTVTSVTNSFVTPTYTVTGYTSAAVTNSLTADATVDLADIDLGAGIEVPPGQVGFVRAARATTATTGGIGANIQRGL